MSNTEIIVVDSGEVLEVEDVLVEVIESDDTTEIIEVGTQGPPGPPATTYTHVQTTDAATWTVNHGLGREPAGVEVLTPGGLRVIASVLHTSIHQLIVTFAAPQQGRVRCS